MNNCLFYTHATLNGEHAEHSLRSLLCNQTEDIVWDNFVIYNTHSYELSNEWLENKIREIDIKNYVGNIIIFPYEELNCPKTLTQDLINQFNLLVDRELDKQEGKTLVLKSDYCLSKNFNKILNKIDAERWLWSLPVYNAKSKVPQSEIYDLCKLEKFEFVFEGVYYRGGTNDPITPGTFYSPHHEYMPYKVRSAFVHNVPYHEHTGGCYFDVDPSIRFVSHNIQNDYNIHVYSNSALSVCKTIAARSLDKQIDWGGANGLFNEAFFCENVICVKEIGAFGVHMYHDIISPNRPSTRPDRRKTVPGEEY